MTKHYSLQSIVKPFIVLFMLFCGTHFGLAEEIDFIDKIRKNGEAEVYQNLNELINQSTHLADVNKIQICTFEYRLLFGFPSVGAKRSFESIEFPNNRCITISQEQKIKHIISRFKTVEIRQTEYGLGVDRIAIKLSAQDKYIWLAATKCYTSHSSTALPLLCFESSNNKNKEILYFNVFFDDLVAIFEKYFNKQQIEDLYE